MSRSGGHCAQLLLKPRGDAFFKQNGFLGNELVLRNYKGDRCHLLSVIGATAQKREESGSKEEVIIVGEVKATLPGQVVSSLQDLQDVDLSDRVVVLLQDKPFLDNISVESFQALKDLIRRPKKFLWVSFTELQAEDYARYGEMKRFLRSMRPEHIDKHIVTLAIESSGDIDYVAKVFHAAFETGSRT